MYISIGFGAVKFKKKCIFKVLNLCGLGVNLAFKYVFVDTAVLNLMII